MSVPSQHSLGDPHYQTIDRVSCVIFVLAAYAPRCLWNGVRLTVVLLGCLTAAIAIPAFAASVATQAVGVQVAKVGVVQWHEAFPGGTTVGVFQIAPKTPDCPRGLGIVDLSNSAGVAMLESLKTARAQNKTINATFASQGPKGYCVALAITVQG